MAGTTSLIGRRILAAFVAAMLVLSVMFLISESPAQADHEPPDATHTSAPGDGSNEAGFWDEYFNLPEDSCWKLALSGGTAFQMPAPPAGEEWVALVVKQGSPSSNNGPDNFIYLDPVEGHSYPSIGNTAPGYSHLIVCSVEETTTTTEPEVTTTEPEVTTTEPEVTTTEPEVTTTEPEVTTTEPEVTTTEPEVTTTTLAATTTTIEILDSTLVNETTTTVEILNSTLVNESTTTIEDEVLGTEVLPFTGADSGMLALLAGALGLLGSLILVATKERAED